MAMDKRSIAAFIEVLNPLINSNTIDLPSKGAGQEKRQEFNYNTRIRGGNMGRRWESKQTSSLQSTEANGKHMACLVT